MPRAAVLSGLMLLVLAACASQRPQPAQRPQRPPAREGVAAVPVPLQRWESTRLGFVWTLPGDWEFFPPDEFLPVPRSGTIEVNAARKKNGKRRANVETMVLVADLMTATPERAWGPEHQDRVEAEGLEQLSRLGAHGAKSRRLKVGDRDAVEVLGTLGERHFSIRYLHGGHRRFEFRCSAPLDVSGWPCEPAFAAFEITDLVIDPPGKPRILHLRDARFGIQFDAPDDGWLAIGPRTAAGGAEVAWTWNDGARQIDLGALDLSAAPGGPPDEALIAEGVAMNLRAGDAKVTVEASSLGGLPCRHVAATQESGFQQDVFILNRGTTNYSVRVSQRVRDAGLLEQVRKGFRLTASR
jgi:hypothetical protein